MREDYKLKGSTTKINLDLEKDVAESLATMEQFTKLTGSEIVNTALKRFISQHKDFFPPTPPRK